MNPNTPPRKDNRLKVWYDNNKHLINPGWWSIIVACWGSVMAGIHDVKSLLYKVNTGYENGVAHERQDSLRELKQDSINKAAAEKAAIQDKYQDSVNRVLLKDLKKKK